MNFQAETMPAVAEMSTSRALQHSVSCPGEVSSMKQEKDIIPSSGMISSSAQNVVDGNSCYNNNSINTKVNLIF